MRRTAKLPVLCCDGLHLCLECRVLWPGSQQLSPIGVRGPALKEPYDRQDLGVDGAREREKLFWPGVQVTEGKLAGWPSPTQLYRR